MTSFCRFKNTFEQTDGLTMGNLRESRKGAIEGLFGYLTKQDTTDIVSPGDSAKQADLFIAVNASTVELTDIEEYIAATVRDKPLIIWNMELDTLRSDLGEHLVFQCSLIFDQGALLLWNTGKLG